MAIGMEKKYSIEGLDCASCAAKVENALNAQNGVKAQLDFLNSTLTVSGAEDEKIHSTVHAAEEGLTLLPTHESDYKCADCNKKTHSHKHEHSHNSGGNDVKSQLKSETPTLLRIAAAALLMLLGFLLSGYETVSFIIFLSAFLVSGADIVWHALKNIFKGQLLDENFLMSLATVGAFAVGEAPEAAFVMIFYQVGELFQRVAVRRSKNSISSLMDLRPDSARAIRNGKAVTVSPEEVRIGEVIEINPGEKIPLDGIVKSGSSLINTAALTGESIPKSVHEGDAVLSGCINTHSVITLEVTAEYAQSTVSKILDLVQNASAQKSPTEQFITKFARYYTPAVVALAAAIAVLCPLILSQPFDKWIYRSLLFLLISCPCALVLSIPLGFFGGIGCAAKNGILVKGGNYLEALSRTEIAVFDKTGTLTNGLFRVTEVIPFGETSGSALLQALLDAEQHSSHPLAKSITEHCLSLGMTPSEVTDIEEPAGMGVICKSEESQIAAGNIKLMKELQINAENSGEATVIFAAKNGRLLGKVLFADLPKEDSAEAVKSLKNLGVKKVVMLTGDNESAARQCAEALGIDEYHAELLPADKLSIVSELKKSLSKNGKLVFVGDGINDAPVLAGADIGTAMGAIGSDAAIEAADVVLMNDEPSLLPCGISLSRRILKRIKAIIAFCLVVKFAVLFLGAVGLASMCGAMFADVGVAVIAVIAALRITKLKSDR